MKKFFKKIWGWIKAPFIWMWENIKDWRTAVIFGITFLLLSSEVWVPYIIGFIAGPSTTLGATMISVASACWLFWLGPFTPFLPLCMAITIGVKAIFNKIWGKKNEKIR